MGGPRQHYIDVSVSLTWRKVSVFAEGRRIVHWDTVSGFLTGFTWNNAIITAPTAITFVWAASFSNRVGGMCLVVLTDHPSARLVHLNI
jgi:hypothetical protein